MRTARPWLARRGWSGWAIRRGGRSARWPRLVSKQKRWPRLISEHHKPAIIQTRPQKKIKISKLSIVLMRLFIMWEIIFLHIFDDLIFFRPDLVKHQPKQFSMRFIKNVNYSSWLFPTSLNWKLQINVEVLPK